MTQAVVFALAVGWVVSWVAWRRGRAIQWEQPLNVVRVLAGRPMHVTGWPVVALRVSWLCGLALAAVLLWRVAGMVAR